MEAKMRVSKWGNSLAVRLPKALVEKLGIAEGDDVDVVGGRTNHRDLEKR
jgi:antitoxin MazE